MSRIQHLMHIFESQYLALSGAHHHLQTGIDNNLEGIRPSYLLTQELTNYTDGAPCHNRDEKR